MGKNRIDFKLDDNIYNMLEFKVKASGKKSRTDFLASIIIDSDIKVDNSRDIVTLVGSINKIGNNINQIARGLNVANRKNILSDIDYDNLLNELILMSYKLDNINKSDNYLYNDFVNDINNKLIHEL